MTGVDLSSKYVPHYRLIIPLRHEGIMHSHICSHGNGDGFTVMSSSCPQRVGRHRVAAY